MKNFWTVISLFAVVLALSSPVAFSQTAPVADKLPTELVKIDDKLGDGPEATEHKVVTVNYTAWLYSPNPDRKDHKGLKFFSTIDGGSPHTFPLGTTAKIKGLSMGIIGMKVGGKRTLYVPGDLGYGKHGFMRGTVPPNAPLLYEVELLEVKD
jgi:FKBP-type peptidyl-prolyl cis-trans isomerase FkpA